MMPFVLKTMHSYTGTDYQLPSRTISQKYVPAIGGANESKLQPINSGLWHWAQLAPGESQWSVRPITYCEDHPILRQDERTIELVFHGMNHFCPDLLTGRFTDIERHHVQHGFRT